MTANRRVPARIDDPAIVRDDPYMRDRIVRRFERVSRLPVRAMVGCCLYGWVDGDDREDAARHVRLAAGDEATLDVRHERQGVGELVRLFVAGRFELRG